MLRLLFLPKRIALKSLFVSNCFPVVPTRSKQSACSSSIRLGPGARVHLRQSNPTSDPPRNQRTGNSPPSPQPLHVRERCRALHGVLILSTPPLGPIDVDAPPPPPPASLPRGRRGALQLFAAHRLAHSPSATVSHRISPTHVHACKSRTDTKLKMMDRAASGSAGRSGNGDAITASAREREISSGGRDPRERGCG